MKKTEVKLSEIVSLWERLHAWNTKEVLFCDLEKAADKVFDVLEDLYNENIPTPALPKEN